MDVKKVLIALLLVAVSCQKAERQKQATTELARLAIVDPTGARNAPEAAKSPFPRMIVRTANVTIVVGDTAAAVEAISRRAEAAGGYLADSRVWREGELLRATLTLRVPAEQLNAMLRSIRQAAKRVDSETVSSDDVSQEYVDLESRLRNLEATEVELRQLLTEVRQRTKRAADVLEVHQQLTAIRAQIEEARGRMRYLGQVTAMSTVSLTVVPDAIAQPVVRPGWQPLLVAREAGRSLVIALQAIATALIWLGIYILPIVLGLWILAYPVWKIGRSVNAWRSRRSAG
jgi:hypothetical protein